MDAELWNLLSIRFQTFIGKWPALIHYEIVYAHSFIHVLDILQTAQTLKIDVGRILSIAMIEGLPCAVLSINILPGIWSICARCFVSTYRCAQCYDDVTIGLSPNTTREFSLLTMTGNKNPWENGQSCWYLLLVRVATNVQVQVRKPEYSPCF